VELILAGFRRENTVALVGAREKIEAANDDEFSLTPLAGPLK
jgi:hypothetical protein